MAKTEFFQRRDWRIRSKQYYARNRDRVLDRQKLLRMAKDMGWEAVEALGYTRDSFLKREKLPGS
jgi:hypothetical protein